MQRRGQLVGLAVLLAWLAPAWAGPAPAVTTDATPASATDATPATATVEVVIDMRAEQAAGRFDPGRDGLGLRGGGGPLSWQKSVPARPGPEPGLWQARLQFTAMPATGMAVAYKFKVEYPGRPDEGWESGRNRSLPLRPGTQRLQRAFGSDPGAPPPQRSGEIERIAPRPSAWVGPREVQVWLPPGYASEHQRRYPVLYLHDGQNVFDAVAAGAEWGVDETAQRLVRAGAVAPMIVVAVASNSERVRDYTPQPATAGAWRGSGGGAAAYGSYLVRELKPFIDARYRTLAGRETTAVGGSSLGGLVTMWLLLSHGDVFGAGLVVSPSVWWAESALLAEVAAAPAGRPAPRIWLDIGTDEGEVALEGARRLRQTLDARSWAPAYLEQAGAGHDEAAWAARVEPMLRFLYGTPR